VLGNFGTNLLLIRLIEAQQLPLSCCKPRVLSVAAAGGWSL